MRKPVYICLTIVLVVIAGLLGYYIGYSSGASQAHHRYEVAVSTTTSLYQLGVVDDILRDFVERYSIDLGYRVIARGSGEALRLLADGSTCIAFTHAPSLELRYMREGRIVRLAIIAYNEFVVVGPSDDPANVSRSRGVIEAFERIFRAGEKGLVKFVSRGDMSGTNIAELRVWNLTGLSPEGRQWYLKSGQGMAQTLVMADSIGGYTLTDIGTYKRLRDQGRIRSLEILLRDPENLINVYSVYLSKAGPCDDPFTWYIAYKLKEYLETWGQSLIESKYRGLLEPARGSENLLLKAWETLALSG